MSGLSQLTGYKGMQPMHVGMSYGDPNAGLHAAFAVIAALFHRERTGKGQYIDMSQWESSMCVIGEAFMHHVMNGEQPERNGNRSDRMSPHGAVHGRRRRCLDRRSSARTTADWQTLCEVMGKPELANDAALPHAGRPQGERGRARDADHGVDAAARSVRGDCKLLQAAGIAAYPPLSNKQVLESKHMESRGFFVEKEHAGSRRPPPRRHSLAACPRRRARSGAPRRSWVRTTSTSSASCWGCPATRSPTWPRAA